MAERWGYGLVLQGEIYTGDGICAGQGWCAASDGPSGLKLSGGGRQMPEFRGLSGRMGAVVARPSISIPSGARLPVSVLRETEWALLAIVGGIEQWM